MGLSIWFFLVEYRRDLWLDHRVVQVGVEHDDCVGERVDGVAALSGLRAVR